MPAAPAHKEVLKATRVDPARASGFRLAKRATRDETLFPDKAAAEASLLADAKRIDELQDALFASQCGSLLVVLQGIDTSGKDGVAKNVFQCTSPLGVRVYPFGRPTDIELAHDYLWRVHEVAPRRGHIAVFNRSHYEDVLVVKVRGFQPADVIEQRYEQINAFEKHLVENGTRVLKLMLHISREEQGVRLRERLEVPEKRWKFNPDDLEDRKLWPDFQAAYETMVQRCSTAHAPWHLIPADSRSRRDAICARLILGELQAMDPKYPETKYRPDQFVID